MGRNTLTRCLITGASLLTAVYAQCPNEVAIYNPSLRTLAVNATFFMIPVPKTAVQTVLDSIYGKSTTGVSNVQLGTVPSDNSLFPQGFPADKHPLMVFNGLLDDIRMSYFQIDGAEMSSMFTIPYVRRFDSQPGTNLIADLTAYLTNEGNNAIGGLVPSVVSTYVEGLPVRLGQFEPSDAPYQGGNDIFTSKCAWVVAPNPVSGPGAYVEAMDMQYISVKSLVKTTAKAIKAMLNQPYILTSVVGALNAGDQCQRNQFYFNNATSTIYPRAGNITLGPGADGATLLPNGVFQKASPDGSGFYGALEGFSSCGQLVGYNPESCDVASKNVDPAAL